MIKQYLLVIGESNPPQGPFTCFFCQRETTCSHPLLLWVGFSLTPRLNTERLQNMIYIYISIEQEVDVFYQMVLVLKSNYFYFYFL